MSSVNKNCGFPHSLVKSLKLIRRRILSGLCVSSRQNYLRWENSAICCARPCAIQQFSIFPMNSSLSAESHDFAVVKFGLLRHFLFWNSCWSMLIKMAFTQHLR